MASPEIVVVAFSSANQRAPSGPAAIFAKRVEVGTTNSVIAPEVVMRPILLPSYSVNHRAPSGPAAMPLGTHRAVGIGNSVKEPDGVTRPMRLAWTAISVNQRFPSGPVVISSGCDDKVGMVNSVIKPSGVIRPIPGLPGRYTVNQTFPSGPAVMPIGTYPAEEGSGDSVNVWSATSGTPRTRNRDRSFMAPPARHHTVGAVASLGLRQTDLERREVVARVRVAAGVSPFVFQHTCDVVVEALDLPVRRVDAGDGDRRRAVRLI